MFALGIVLGIFADQRFNPSGSNGLLHGNPSFFYKLLAAVLFSSAWAFIFTYGMLKIIDMFTTAKVDVASEEAGLDVSLHGERAYEEF